MKNNELKELRNKLNLTQQECADILGMSLRNYVRYEDNENNLHDSLRYSNIIYQIKNYKILDETHGILSLNYIKTHIKKICKTNTSFVYLFGDYAFDPKEDSSIKLLVSSSISLTELKEKIKGKLNKKIEIYDFNDYLDNKDIIKKVLISGIKIL